MDTTELFRQAISVSPFKKSATYNGSEPFDVLLNRGGETMLKLETGEFTGNELHARVIADDVEGIKQGDIITIDSVDYYVMSVDRELNSPTYKLPLSLDEVIA